MPTSALPVRGRPGGGRPSAATAPPSGRATDVTRRSALAGAAVVLVAGCAVRLESDPPPSPTPAPPGADELARERVAATSDRLADLVVAAVAARPELSRALDPVTQAHRAHAVALRPPATVGGSSPSTSALPTPNATSADPLAALLAGERSAAAATAGELAGVGPGTARLLASVGAAQALSADLVAGLARS